MVFADDKRKAVLIRGLERLSFVFTRFDSWYCVSNLGKMINTAIVMEYLHTFTLYTGTCMYVFCIFVPTCTCIIYMILRHFLGTQSNNDFKFTSFSFS